MTTIRYRTVRFRVESRGQIVRTQFKLPLNMKVCTGYLMKVTGYMPAGQDQKEVGIFSIEFNSKKELTVNDVIGYEEEVELKPEFQMMHVELEKGAVANCVYMDKYPGHLNFSPYVVSLYLKCSTVCKAPQHV